MPPSAFQSFRLTAKHAPVTAVHGRTDVVSPSGAACRATPASTCWGGSVDECDAAVLDGVIRVGEEGSGGTAALRRQTLGERPNPIGVGTRNIIIEENQCVTTARGDPGSDECGIVEWPVLPYNDVHGGPQKVQRLGVRRAVVDQNEFYRWPIRPFHCCDDLLEQGRLVARWDDHAHDRPVTGSRRMR